METLESSRVCRLCGKQSGISINIFDKNDNHVKKINAVLPIMVHEMDLLPKHMCHRCSYKLEEFHKFYVDCLKTDTNLKSQLSWMSKEHPKERIGVPMVQIENVKIKEESPDYDCYELDPIVDRNVNYINTIGFPVRRGQRRDIAYTTYTPCGCPCSKRNRKETLSKNFNKSISGSASTNLKKHGKTVGGDPSIDKLGGESLQSNQATINSIRGGDALSTIARTLRPRIKSVDYLGTRVPSVSERNSRNRSAATGILDVSQIKVENDPRILRPRKRTIDYLEPKKKNTVKRIGGRIKSGSKIFLGNKLTYLKQEVLSDPEEQKKTTQPLKNPPSESSGNALPSKILANVQNDLLNYSVRSRVSLGNRRPVGRPKKTEREKISKRLGSNQIERMTRHSLKCLQSQNVFLRSGRLRRLEDPKKVPSAIKLSGNIKRYCEECDTSFASKELYMLHACYV